jgi:hypothetical protein
MESKDIKVVEGSKYKEIEKQSLIKKITLQMIIQSKIKFR